MSDDRLIKKLHTGFKMNGLLVRREFCQLINNTFKEKEINLNENTAFEKYIKQLCDTLERQCTNDKSIEKTHVEEAIEACLNSGYDKHESIFTVIDAFNFPKLFYDPDRKIYFRNKTGSKLLSDVDSKAQLFIDRYSTVLQRTQRNIKNKLTGDGDNQLALQTVNYLLTLTRKTLNKTLILGAFIQVSEGKYYLEDPTGIVQLNLKHAVYDRGFFVENSFVLVNGIYEDKILQVSSVILPPGEEYNDSKHVFNNLNYFGGPSETPLRDSLFLKENMMRNSGRMMFFFSNLCLDRPSVFEKLEVIFNGMQASPPIAFIFMGNFTSQAYGSECLNVFKKLFKQLGELIKRYTTLIEGSEFIFVPGMLDPCTPHIVPRLPLPKLIADELLRYVPKATFTTNPCRIQYCTREINVLRADMLPKLMQVTLHRPEKEQIGDCMAKTLIGQGHLSPLPLDILTVHWDYDYTMRLYPLPDLVVIGDKSEGYQGEYKGCQVINPGSFYDSGFQFKCYIPASNTVEDCIV